MSGAMISPANYGVGTGRSRRPGAPFSLPAAQSDGTPVYVLAAPAIAPSPYFFLSVWAKAADIIANPAEDFVPFAGGADLSEDGVFAPFSTTWRADGSFGDQTFISPFGAPRSSNDVPYPAPQYFDLQYSDIDEGSRFFAAALIPGARGYALPMDSAWHHLAVFASFEDDGGAFDAAVFVDGSEITSSVVPSVSGATPPFNVAWDKLSLFWCPQEGEYAEFYLNTKSKIDPRDPAVLRKFIRAGKPVSLGPAGARPTGTAADIFLSGAGYLANSGTAGNFVLSSGTAVSVAPSSPTD